MKVEYRVLLYTNAGAAQLELERIELAGRRTVRGGLSVEERLNQYGAEGFKLVRAEAVGDHMWLIMERRDEAKAKGATVTPIVTNDKIHYGAGEAALCGAPTSELTVVVEHVECQGCLQKLCRCPPAAIVSVGPMHHRKCPLYAPAEDK